MLRSDDGAERVFCAESVLQRHDNSLVAYEAHVVAYGLFRVERFAQHDDKIRFSHAGGALMTEHGRCTLAIRLHKNQARLIHGVHVRLASD